jgi:hypothetical protein
LHGGHDPSGSAGTSPATVVTGIAGPAAAGGPMKPGAGCIIGSPGGAGITGGAGYAIGWAAVCG